MCVVLLAHYYSTATADDGNTHKRSQDFPPGDVRNCPTKSPVFPDTTLYRMEVLPGGGFDVLRGLDMGQVHAYRYSKCSVSNDGRYLLTDNVFIIPSKKSHVQVFAEFIAHWDNFTSTTSSSITAQAGFESVTSGKFSDEYLSVKSHQYSDQAMTTRVQIRYLLYKVQLQPGSQLHPTFKSRLFEIAENIHNNNTDFAYYLAELTVRDYGTHFITSMDAGAVLSQVDHIVATAFTQSYLTKNTATASASANFFNKVSFSSSFSHSSASSHTQAFVDNRTYSEVFSWGGPPFSPNFTVTDWQNGVPDSLVAIDRSGDPLHLAITPTALPEMPESTVNEVANMVFRAIAQYYKINTRHGCTDVNSPNFDFQANVHDNSCEPKSTNFTFGGIYQTCKYASEKYEDLCNSGPQPMEQVNPLTGSISCLPPYSPVLLHSGQYRHTIRKQVCDTQCSWWNCHNNCALRPFTTVINYSAYWCYGPAHISQKSGYLFGGYYTSTTANPFTGTKSCPRYFLPLHFGEDIYICASNDYELGFEYSIPFAGFESCIAGNPLAIPNQPIRNETLWPHACPTGYAQHLVAVDEGCEINFCIKAGAFNQLKPLPPRLPPYRKHKQKNLNATNTLIVIGNVGDLKYKNVSGEWVSDDSYDTRDGKMLMETLNIIPQPGPPQHTLMESNVSSDTDSDSSVMYPFLLFATITLGGFLIWALYCAFKTKMGEDDEIESNEGTKG